MFVLVGSRQNMHGKSLWGEKFFWKVDLKNYKKVVIGFCHC